MDNRKSVSIVVPNYNGRRLLEEYLPYTLSAIKNAGVNYELIIVDDCSTDDSVLFITSAYPGVKLLANTENRGFSFSCNRGIEAAKYELILLLNSDVKLSPDYFGHQWKYFTIADTFGVMGRIIDMRGENIQDAARVPKFNGFKLKTDYFYYTDSKTALLLTFYLSGANALIDAAKLKSIGGFYELFSPFYCEDMELSIRAWRLNWKCYYEHNAVCRHEVSASTKSYAAAKRVKSIYYRNRFYLHALHLNGFKLFAWYLQITLIDLLPKLIIGQTWIWESYKNLFRNKKDIEQYKDRIKYLMVQNGSETTVFDVVEKIRSSVNTKETVRFKP